MKFVIKGGKNLSGEITLAGAKNAATKMMVASLLTEEPCTLENCPNIGDAEITAELCRELGSRIERHGGTLKIHTAKIASTKVLTLSRRNRIPILALGPLLTRVGEAQIPVLGGDQIGPRPVDMHLEGLRAMGAEIRNDDHHFFAKAAHGLHGAHIKLRYPSVMATENIIIAATLAQGRTVIENAAKEPEILDLIAYLQKMGAIIEIGAHRRIYIDGVLKLRGATHRILPDRNEAVSFGALALASGGNILVKGARQDHLLTFLSAIRRIGGDYEVNDQGIRFFRPDGLKATEIETDPHPGFMTDWQQPFAVLLTQVEGTSIIHETVYEDRFAYVEDLKLMGADIKVFTKCLGQLSCRFSGKDHNHSALITGPTPLHGALIKVKDLRAGIAHIVAALIAKGESVIDGAEEVDRGYERIDERLRALGADIKRLA